MSWSTIYSVFDIKSFSSSFAAYAEAKITTSCYPRFQHAVSQPRWASNCVNGINRLGNNSSQASQPVYRETHTRFALDNLVDLPRVSRYRSLFLLVLASLLVLVGPALLLAIGSGASLLLVTLLAAVLALLLGRLLLLLLLPVLDLVLNQVVEGGDGPDQTAEIELMNGKLLLIKIIPGAAERHDAH